MAEQHLTNEIGVAEPPQSHNKAGFLTPDATVALLTWITFFALLAILKKFAWKPILDGLDAREEKIRKALDDARKAGEELAKINQTRASVVAAADNQAREIVERSRKAAVEAAKAIEHKARDEAQIVINNAQHELQANIEKARMELREESVNIAVGLTQKILEEEFDDAKHQRLMDKLIKNFRTDDYQKS